MTMVADFCSQIILQKSFTVSCLGPVSRRWSQSQTERSLRALGLWPWPSGPGNGFPTRPEERGDGPAGPFHTLQSPRTGVGSSLPIPHPVLPLPPADVPLGLGNPRELSKTRLGDDLPGP